MTLVRQNARHHPDAEKLSLTLQCQARALSLDESNMCQARNGRQLPRERCKHARPYCQRFVTVLICGPCRGGTVALQCAPTIRGLRGWKATEPMPADEMAGAIRVAGPARAPGNRRGAGRTGHDDPGHPPGGDIFDDDFESTFDEPPPTLDFISHDLILLLLIAYNSIRVSVNCSVAIGAPAGSRYSIVFGSRNPSISSKSLATTENTTVPLSSSRSCNTKSPVWLSM